MTYGYVRVSSRDQNEERQMIAMQDFGVEKKQIYLDKQSGKDFERPAYKRMVQRIFLISQPVQTSAGQLPDLVLE